MEDEKEYIRAYSNVANYTNYGNQKVILNIIWLISQNISLLMDYVSVSIVDKNIKLFSSLMEWFVNKETINFIDSQGNTIL